MDIDYGVIPALIVLVGIVIAWLAIRRIALLRTKGYPAWRRLGETIVFGGIGLMAVVVAVCSGFNALAQHHFRAKNMPGQLYVVNGHTMHMTCMGSGSPVIVLDAGLGNDSLIWGGVQPALAKTTRACSYDRAGFGWSDALPGPRDADHIAMELHGLLAAAKIDAPIVLMGHSISGIYIRDYASRYPKQVAGLIFVDGSTPLQNRNAAFKDEGKGPPRWLGMLLSKSVFAVGIPRLYGECSRSFHGFDASAAKLQAEELCHPQLSAIAGEMDSFDRSGEETVHTGPYGALPILILSQDTSKARERGEPAAMGDAWNQMQDDLKNLSTRSRRIIAKGSPHYIQLERPELIEKEVPLFIEEIRGTAPQPTNFGATVTE